MTQLKRALAIAMLIAASGLTSISAHAADYNWKFYTFFNSNDFAARMQRAFAEDVTKATGGRLAITLYAAGEMPFKVNEVLRAVATDQVQMGDMGISTVPGELPGLQVLDLPFICGDYTAFYSALKDVAPIISQRMTEKFGVTPLINWTMPAQNLWLRDNIKTMDDLKGRKVRIYSRLHQQMLDNFGAVGVSLSGAEITGALDRGVVDGAITAAIPALDWKFPELAKHGYMLGLQFAHEMLVVNVGQLNALPADIRGILLAKAKEWEPKFKEMVSEAEQKAIVSLKEKGQVFITPSPDEKQRLRQLALPIWDSWATNAEQKQLVDNAKKACS